MLKKALSLLVIACFFLTTLLFPQPYAYAEGLGLPTPGTMVNLSPAYEPALIKGLTIHKDNPFLFDFIVDSGNSGMTGYRLKEEGDRLVKYFFACLTIPEKDLWVNLSPYEKNRIVPQVLGQTALGRDLLAQDYLLKQLTASLIYPEKALGKKFWERVYTKAQQLYGTTQIPVDTFNKVWIVADKASVFEHGQSAFVISGHLKVMLEEDYLALGRHSEAVRSATKSVNTLSSQIIRSIVLPEIEKEVNKGKNFSTLRQIFNSLILASWYKRDLKEALLTQVYADKNTIKGINLTDPSVKEQIYQQYLKAYKKGVFHYIKEEPAPPLDGDGKGVVVTRKYFSGGFDSNLAMTVDKNPADAAQVSGPIGNMLDLTVGLTVNSAVNTSDAAMSSVSALGQFFLEGAELTSSQREAMVKDAHQQGYQLIAPAKLTKQLNDWAEDLEELMALNPQGIEIIRQNAPVLANQINHLIEFLRAPPEDGKIQINGETYTLNIFVHPTFKLLEAAPGLSLPSFSIKDVHIRTLTIYARRLNDIVYELLKQIIFKNNARELDRIGASSPIAQAFLAFMAQAIVRQEIYTGSDVPVVIPRHLLDEPPGMSIDQLQSMILDLDLLKPKIKDILKGKENSYAQSFIDVLKARLELLLLQKEEKAKEQAFRKADESKKKDLLGEFPQLRRHISRVRLILAGYRDKGLRKVESFHTSESFDTGQGGSKIFVPQVQAFGAAWGDWRVLNRPLLRAGRDYLSAIGIRARHFMDPSLNVYDLGLRSVIFMIINHTVSLPKEDFEKAVQRAQSHPVLGKRLNSDQIKRAAAAKTADERLDILKEGYGDIVSIAKAMGPEVLGDVKRVLVYSSTLVEGQEPVSTETQKKLLDFGLKRGTVSKAGNGVCAGFGPATEEAIGLLRDGKVGSVLVIMPEKYSDILDMYQRSSGGLFGDVSVAYKLGQPDPKVTVNSLDLRLFPGASVTYGELAGFITVAHQNDRRGRFDMLRNTVLQFVNQVPVIVEEYLDRHGITLEQIDYMVTHQPQKNGIRSLAKAFGIGTIVTITPDGQATEEDTGYGKPGIKTKMIWVGEELANGGGAATPAALRLLLSARYKTEDKERLGALLVDPSKETSFLTAAFGGGGQIAVNLAIAKPPGENWNPTDDQIRTVQEGQTIDPINSEGRIDTGAFALRLGQTPDRPYASPLPRQTSEHKLLERLRELGQDINRVLPEAQALPMEKVLVLGAGQQGGPRIAELAQIKEVKKIYVYSRNKSSFDAMIEQIGKDYGDELKEKVQGMTEWVQSGDPRQSDVDHHLKQLLLKNDDIKLAFEILTEDKRIKEDRIRAIWQTRRDVCIISNSSSLSIVEMAESVAQSMGLDNGERQEQLARVLLMHDHTPFSNMFLEISDPRKRNIDPKLYASARVFANQIGHVSVLVDDKKPMAQVGNMAWFGGEFLAALSLWSRGYSPEVIRRAAATYEKPLLSPDLQVELPAPGPDPFETAAIYVGVEVTDDILKNMAKTLGLNLDDKMMRAWNMYLKAFREGKDRRGIYESRVNEKGKIELLHREEDGTFVPAKPGKPPSLTPAAQRVTDQLRLENGTPSTDQILSDEEALAKIRQELWLGRFAGAGRVLDADILTHPRYIDTALSWFAMSTISGGVLKMIDRIGPRKVLRLLLKYRDQYGELFAPFQKLRTVVAADTTFTQQYGEPDDIAPRHETEVGDWEKIFKEWKGTEYVTRVGDSSHGMVDELGNFGAQGAETPGPAQWKYEPNRDLSPLEESLRALTGRQLLKAVLDDASGFIEINGHLETADSLGFAHHSPDKSYLSYLEKIVAEERRTGEKSGVITGVGTIGGVRVAIASMHRNFFAGTLSPVEGEKIARLVEFAGENKLPLVIMTASGGARMQQSAESLMQLPKISSIIKKYREQGGHYVSVLMDPTTGGVSASFAFQSDYVMAEAGALIAFAGPNLVRMTMGVPKTHIFEPGFQRAEALKRRGYVNEIFSRGTLKEQLASYLHKAIAGGKIKATNNWQRVRYVRTPLTPESLRDIRSLSSNLSAFEQLNLARDPKRPNFKEYLKIWQEQGIQFEEMFKPSAAPSDSKDPTEMARRIGSQAIVGGVLTFSDGKKIMLIGSYKGNGVGKWAPGPEGYRRSRQMMLYAQQHGLSIVTLVDLAGALSSPPSENEGIFKELAMNQELMSTLTVPVLSIITGQGGSGGAIAIGMGNIVLMMQNTFYSVISPEYAAEILYQKELEALNDSEKEADLIRRVLPELVASLKISPSDLFDMGIVDGVIREPAAGAQADPRQAANNLLQAINETLPVFNGMSAQDIRDSRLTRYANMGSIAVSSWEALKIETVYFLDHLGLTQIEKTDVRQWMDEHRELLKDSQLGHFQLRQTMSFGKTQQYIDVDVKREGERFIVTRTINHNGTSEKQSQAIYLKDGAFEASSGAQAGKDAAMGTTADFKERLSVPGGIDLNTSNGMQWKISKDGKSVEMNIDPAMVQRIRRGGINSLSPVIVMITPITSIGSLVGFQYSR